jgi:hypothetical protein
MISGEPTCSLIATVTGRSNGGRPLILLRSAATTLAVEKLPDRQPPTGGIKVGDRYLTFAGPKIGLYLVKSSGCRV